MNTQKFSTSISSEVKWLFSKLSKAGNQHHIQKKLSVRDANRRISLNWVGERMGTDGTSVEVANAVLHTNLVLSVIADSWWSA
jgi:hypothetical protein